MSTREFKSGFELWGWAMAAAAALVFFGVGMLGMGLGFMQAAFVAVVIFVIVGLLTGMPRTEPMTFDTLRAEALAAKALAKAHAPAAPTAPQKAPAAAPATMLAAAMAKSLTAEPAPVADLPAGGPERLTAPRNGKADDLKEIEGIGPSMEKLCNEMGFYHFEQISNWSDADIEWVDANMKSFKGRIVRDKWVAQAKLIMSEGLDAFRIRAKTNDY